MKPDPFTARTRAAEAVYAAKSWQRRARRLQRCGLPAQDVDLARALRDEMLRRARQYLTAANNRSAA